MHHLDAHREGCRAMRGMERNIGGGRIEGQILHDDGLDIGDTPESFSFLFPSNRDSKILEKDKGLGLSAKLDI